MNTATETPDQLLDRLERMGIERVRRLVGINHFDPKARGLVKGWIQRKEEEARAPEPEPMSTAPAIQQPDAAVVQEGLRMARRAIREATAAREATAQLQRMNTIAIGTATVAIVVSVLALFALALI